MFCHTDHIIILLFPVHKINKLPVVLLFQNLKWVSVTFISREGDVRKPRRIKFCTNNDFLFLKRETKAAKKVCCDIRDPQANVPNYRFSLGTPRS